jgi:hypothetical protein
MLESKIRLRAQVTDSEVRGYFDAHRGELPGDFEKVRSSLKDKLVRDRYQQLVQAELEQLKRTHDVRRMAPFSHREERG